MKISDLTPVFQHPAMKEVLEIEHPAHSQGQLHQVPSFHAYEMFSISCSYARLKPIFEKTARGKLGKHKKAVFTMVLTGRMINHPHKRHYPIKATKPERLKFTKKQEMVTETIEPVQGLG